MSWNGLCKSSNLNKPVVFNPVFIIGTVRERLNFMDTGTPVLDQIIWHIGVWSPSIVPFFFFFKLGWETYFLKLNHGLLTQNTWVSRRYTEEILETIKSLWLYQNYTYQYFSGDRVCTWSGLHDQEKKTGIAKFAGGHRQVPKLPTLTLTHLQTGGNTSIFCMVIVKIKEKTT